MGIRCPSELRSRKTVPFSEQIIFVDKYPSIFRVKWMLLFILVCLERGIGRKFSQVGFVHSVSETKRTSANSDHNPKIYITGKDSEDKSTTGKPSSQHGTG